MAPQSGPCVISLIAGLRLNSRETRSMFCNVVTIRLQQLPTTAKDTFYITEAYNYNNDELLWKRL